MRSAGEEIIDDFGGDIAAFLRSCKERTRVKMAKRRVEHGRWRQMMRRCYDPRSAGFPNYGGRGIRVVQAWHDFETFYRDMGPVPGPGLTLDRQDNDGDYGPGNCRWATATEQVANRRPRAAQGSVLCVNGKWRALIRLRGKSACKTFAVEADARQWAAQTIATMTV